MLIYCNLLSPLCVCLYFISRMTTVHWVYVFWTCELKMYSAYVCVHVHVSVWRSRSAMTLVWKSKDILQYVSFLSPFFQQGLLFATTEAAPAGSQASLESVVWLWPHCRRAGVINCATTPTFMWCWAFEPRSSHFLSKGFAT